MNRVNQLAKYIATLGEVGYLPAPGTMGTVVAALLLIPLKLLVSFFPASLMTVARAELFILFFLTSVAFLIIRQALVLLSFVHDPRQIVLDELIGCWWAFATVKLTLSSLLLGVFLFRVLDISKPWCIGYVERLPGAWGILLDDVCAGIVTMAILKLWY